MQNNLRVSLPEVRLERKRTTKIANVRIVTGYCSWDVIGPCRAAAHSMGGELPATGPSWESWVTVGVGA